jgi:hypothetical protein
VPRLANFRQVYKIVRICIQRKYVYEFQANYQFMEHKITVRGLNLADFDKTVYCCSDVTISGRNNLTKLTNLHLNIPVRTAQ